MQASARVVLPIVALVVALTGCTGGENGPAGGAAPTSATSAPPTSWTELDRRLAEVAPQVGMLTARIGENGRCEPVHAIAGDTARPLGSIFKLWVLAAVARAVDRGELTWDQSLTITEQLKSLFSGVLQYRPAGSTVTVAEAARLMISISDNTATDLLIDAVGRPGVEAELKAAGASAAERNIPFLTTREMSVVKGADYPAHRDAYLALDPVAQRDYLDTTVAGVPLADVRTWTMPRDITTIEWFGSPMDVCRAFAELKDLARRPGLQPVGAALSAYDGGLPLGSSGFEDVWFKAGAEPGVATTAWHAVHPAAGSLVTVLLTADPEQVIEPAAMQELLSLAAGALRLTTG